MVMMQACVSTYPWMRQPGGGDGVGALPGCGCGGRSWGEEAVEEGSGGLHFGWGWGWRCEGVCVWGEYEGGENSSCELKENDVFCRSETRVEFYEDRMNQQIGEKCRKEKRCML